MNIFVAGASGALGMPIVIELLRLGHRVTAMTRSESGSERLAALGAAVERIDAFDSSAVMEALRRSSPEVVIDQLTALPKNPAALASAFPHDRRLRLEGGGNVHAAALAVGARRYIQQSSGFYLKARKGKIADEEDTFDIGASPAISLGAQMFHDVEERAIGDSRMEGVALRYGFFYGPHTWYNPDGGAADQVCQGAIPIIGDGKAVSSFIHVADAATATVAALTADCGIYNIVDDHPVAVHEWLPAFAQWVQAPPPPHISEEEALTTAGPDAVYYHTKLCGASNAKAKKLLGFRPRRLEWLSA
jgi:nucleoside-diphosphate-sugar epimerase